MRNIALLLVTALALNTSALAFQTPQPSETKPQTKEERQAAKAKAEVQKRGINSRVRVSLRNKTEVKGDISKMDENSFEVTDKKSGKTTTIAYADVEKVKGPGLSKGAKIAITVGVVAGIVIGIAVAVVATMHE